MLPTTGGPRLIVASRRLLLVVRLRCLLGLRLPAVIRGGDGDVCACFQRGSDRKVNRIQYGTRRRKSVLHECRQPEGRREVFLRFEVRYGLLLLLLISTTTLLLLLLLYSDCGGFVIYLGDVTIRHQCREGSFTTFGRRGGTRCQLCHLGNLGIVRVEAMTGFVPVQFAGDFLEHVLVRLNPGGLRRWD